MKQEVIYDKNFKTEMDLKQRVIKFHLSNGSWRTFWNPCNTKFKRLLVEYQPIGVYRSVSRWLRFGERPSYPNIIINSEQILDFDNEEDFKKIKRVDELIQKSFNNLKLKYQLNSGGGFHLLYEITESPKIANIYDRLEYYIQDKAKIVKFLKERGIEADYEVCKDVYRVSRIENTLNYKRGSICHSLVTKPVENDWQRMKRREKLIPFPPAKVPADGGFETTLPRNFSYNYIKNNVIGTKGLYCPVIKWKQIRKKRLKKLMKVYKLGSFMQINAMDNVYLMFFKCCDYERITKIYKFALSSNYNEFIKYKHNWLGVKSDDFKVKMTYFPLKDKNGAYSRPHLEFFDISTKDTLCGRGDLKVYKAECELRN